MGRSPSILRYAFSMLTLLLLADQAGAQSRTIGAGELVIDDGAGQKVTIAAPAGMTGDVDITLPTTSGSILSVSGTPTDGDVMTYSSGTPQWQAAIGGSTVAAGTVVSS